MANSVRQQPASGRRANATYAPPVASELDPLNPVQFPPLVDDEPRISNQAEQVGQFNQGPRIEPEMAYFGPIAWVIALAVVGGIAYYLFASPGTTQPTMSPAPVAQTQPAPSTSTTQTGTLPAVPTGASKSDGATVTPPADATAVTPPVNAVPKAN